MSTSMIVIMLFSLCVVAGTSITASAQAPTVGSADIASGASVCSTGNDVYLFAMGADSALWVRHWTAGGWSGWTSLGGVITASPAAVYHGNGIIDVFVRGSNGALYQQTYLSGQWQGWTKIGGYLFAGTGPAVTAPDANTLAVFVTGGNQALYYQKWQSSGGWQGWQNLGGVLTASPGAAARSSSAIDVVVRGSNGAPYERSTTNGGSSWGGWQKLSGAIAGASEVHVDLFYLPGCA